MSCRDHGYVPAVLNKLHHFYPGTRHPRPVRICIRVLLKACNRGSVELKVHLSQSFFLDSCDRKGFRPEPNDIGIVEQNLAPNIEQNVGEKCWHGCLVNHRQMLVATEGGRVGAGKGHQRAQPGRSGVSDMAAESLRR
jgi:hypothetical protein